MRPEAINEYVGQKRLKEIIEFNAEGASVKNESFPHSLFYGPAGSGKTTLAKLIASHTNSDIKIVNSSHITKPSEIATILSTLNKNEVLFIDEIHRLPAIVEETLYSAMEDFELNIPIGQGVDTQVVTVELDKFTLVGATTKLGSLTKPLTDRFIIKEKMEDYSIEEIALITSSFVKKRTSETKISITKEAAFIVATRSRKTPRIAINLTQSLENYAIFYKCFEIDEPLAKEFFSSSKIDEEGLGELDYNYLKSFENKKILGIKTLSSILDENEKTIEETIEPFLISLGFIEKSPKGRILTEKGNNKLKTILELF